MNQATKDRAIKLQECAEYQYNRARQYMEGPVTYNDRGVSNLECAALTQELARIYADKARSILCD